MKLIFRMIQKKDANNFLNDLKELSLELNKSDILEMIDDTLIKLKVSEGVDVESVLQDDSDDRIRGLKQTQEKISLLRLEQIRELQESDSGGNYYLPYSLFLHFLRGVLDREENCNMQIFNICKKMVNVLGCDHSIFAHFKK